MKKFKLLLISLALLTLVTSCEEDATTGQIEGTLSAGTSVNASDLNNIKVYLWTSDGTNLIVEIDSTTTDDNNEFEFTKIEFNTYQISLKPNFTISPEPETITLDSDHTSSSVSYSVEASDNMMMN